MNKLLQSPRNQHGFFLILAVILILIMGLMGVVIVHTFSSRAALSVAQLNGNKAFYNAESAVEIGTRLLTIPNLTGTPSRLSCDGINGAAALTNASLNGGTFTITTTVGSPVRAVSTLSAATTAAATTITLSSTAGFADAGKMYIDREVIEYAGLSGNTLVGVTRGVSSTAPASHVSGAAVTQYLCPLDAKAGIPSLNNPSYQREIQWNVQLEEAWAVGVAVSSSVWNVLHWNYPNELQWTLSTASGGTQQLNGVSMVSNADVWAVGAKSTAIHYNGIAATALDVGIPSGDNLMSVSAVSSREAWTCSDQGKVYRWTPATNWVNPYTPGNNPSAISMVDTSGDGLANAGWVVGAKKSAAFFNGSSWASANGGISVDLNSVSTLTASDAWAAGNSGRVFRWNGSSWATATTPTTATLNSISMIQINGVDYGWAVGASSAAIYFNGTSWVSQNSGLGSSLTLNGVATLSTNDAWAVASNGGIYRWNGSTWTLSATSSKGLQAVCGLQDLQPPTSGWQQVFR